LVSASRHNAWQPDTYLPQSGDRINVIDDEASWAEGGVSLGGGWLPVEFSGVTINSLATDRSSAIDELGNTTWKAPTIDKSRLRLHQREAYRPIELPSLDQPRVACSLDGNWLFLPDQELAASVALQSEILDDRRWHVMDVPNFWTPTLS
jgi:hypothetical protein